MAMEFKGYQHPQSFFEEFPPDSEWDVVIIGAGPNGLIAAAYLAKSEYKKAATTLSGMPIDQLGAKQ